MDLRKYVWHSVLLGLLTIGGLCLFLPHASADAPPDESSVSDPFFREEAPAPDPYFREEAPERLVECDNYVFVPMGEGGTWDCPPYIPQEPIQPQCTDPMVECACDHWPSGCTGGVPPEGEGTSFVETTQEPAAPVASSEERPRVTPAELLLYGSAGVGLVLVAIGTLYMIYREGTP